VGAARDTGSEAAVRYQSGVGAAPAEPTTADLLAAIEQLHAEVRQLRQSTPQQLVDLQTAADHLCVSTRTLKRWVRDEEVAYRRVGRTLRFPLAALNPPQA
jgi:excisionase family DNA binding protein